MTTDDGHNAVTAARMMPLLQALLTELQHVDKLQNDASKAMPVLVADCAGLMADLGEVYGRCAVVVSRVRP